MNALQRFEDFVERMVEGSFTRLFRGSVQPAEIARRIERAMESNLVAGVGHQYTPNQYRVRLHPDDFKPFEPYRKRMEREMAAFVREAAHERGWDLVGPPRVIILPNGEVARYTIEVQSRLVDGTDRTMDIEEPGEYQPTTAMPIMKPVAPPRRAPPPLAGPVQPPASLRLLDGSAQGSVVQIRKPLIALGRGLDNDVVVEDSRVSRHHAQILFQHQRYTVRDLGSTNHTFVNGRPIETSVLAPGDRISLGGVELEFGS